MCPICPCLHPCRYVEQTDVHMPQTTVSEACHFSARLRLPTSVDAATRQTFVEEVGCHNHC